MKFYTAVVIGCIALLSVCAEVQSVDTQPNAQTNQGDMFSDPKFAQMFASLFMNPGEGTPEQMQQPEIMQMLMDTITKNLPYFIDSLGGGEWDKSSLSQMLENFKKDEKGIEILGNVWAKMIENPRNLQLVMAIVRNPDRCSPAKNELYTSLLDNIAAQKESIEGEDSPIVGVVVKQLSSELSECGVMHQEVVDGTTTVA